MQNAKCKKQNAKSKKERRNKAIRVREEAKVRYRGIGDRG